MAGAPLGHARQDGHRDLHGGEIVQPHQPLEIVQAIVRVLDRAADRAAGVVDQHVDPAMLAQHLLDEGGALRRIGNVGAVGLDFEVERREFLAPPACPGRARRSASSRRLARASARSPCRCRPSRRSPARLAADAAAQRLVDEQGRIEMALPIVPEPPGVALERRDGDAGRAQQLVGLAGCRSAWDN